jgi:hypothetical protein
VSAYLRWLRSLPSLDLLVAGLAGMLGAAAVARWVSPVAGLPLAAVFGGWFVAGVWLVVGEMVRGLREALDALRGER